MTRKTIAILRKLVRHELKEWHKAKRNAARYGGWTAEDKAWVKGEIVKLEECLDEIKRYADGER